jgi:hypothetical protein
MCFREKNVLIEIKWPKEYWGRVSSIKYAKLFLLNGMMLEDDPFSSYHTMVYRDIRRYKNQRKAIDRRDRVIWIYGDKK